MREKKRTIAHCEFQIFVADHEKRFAPGHWSFLGPGSEKKWYGTHSYQPNGKWVRVAEDMMLNFSESEHSVFRGSSAVERGDLKSKGKGKSSVHFCANDKPLKCFFARSSPSISSVSTEHWRTCATNWPAESPVVQKKYRGTCCPGHSRNYGFSSRIDDIENTPRTDENVQGNLLHEYEQKFTNLPDHLQLIKLCYEDRGEVTVFHEPRRCGIGQSERLMPRVYSTYLK